MSAQQWDERYATGRQWSLGPTAVLAEFAPGLAPGRVLDLAGGEGRNGLWLAGLGWQVVVVDFSAVALERGRQRQAELGVECEWLQADLTTYQPEPAAFDLVLLAFLHLPAAEQAVAVGRAAGAVAPGGALLMVGHHPRNLAEGVGGPQDPAIMHDEQTLAGWVTGAAGGAALTIERAAAIGREVPAGRAIDALVVARRPGAVAAG